MNRWTRSYERELVCGRCGSVMAQLSVGLFQHPRLRSARGDDVTPVGGWLYYQAQEQLETARILVTAGDVGEGADREDRLDVDGALGDRDRLRVQRERIAHAQARFDYLKRTAGELSYELDCPGCRGRYLRTLPALLIDVRAADSDRVVLERQPQDAA
jgi:hypothetical protein